MATELAIAANEQVGDQLDPKTISPISKELVIGLVAYAGAGSSTAAARIRAVLEAADYEVHIIKMSELIAGHYSGSDIPILNDGPKPGLQKLNRARSLQDYGDTLRTEVGDFALASLAIGKIREKRGTREAGADRIAFIIETLKHREEVEMFRRVYHESFRLVAVHCDRETRETRLAGKPKDPAKYAGASIEDVRIFMDRDEKDGSNNHGQQVRDAFYLADYFLDNTEDAASGANLTDDVDRFTKLVLGNELVRPTLGERAMYHAHASAMQSSCLSRQVGAALVSSSGDVVATGTNDVPRYGGGVYSEGDKEDNRCHAWEWTDGKIKFIGCHNDRRKSQLRKDISRWIADEFAEKIAEVVHPEPNLKGLTLAKARADAEAHVRQVLEEGEAKFEGIPGVKDLIEYSRAIHAEMDAVLSAARAGFSTVGTSLFCTTYPCHSCARHLVTAGVAQVFFIEPYVKSLATELHYDAIANRPLPTSRPPKPQQQMTVIPFTGVGPRMYEDFFTKKVGLKGAGGAYTAPKANTPSHAVRLLKLSSVEDSAVALVRK